MELKNYKNIIFDFDGVIVDSNDMKKSAIFKAADQYTIAEKRDEFVEYFIHNNGLPRELKINNYFDKTTSAKILNLYNSLLKTMLINTSFTTGFQNFLNLVKFNQLNSYIVSGGDKNEIIDILKSNNILEHFIDIKAAPYTKEKNIEMLNINCEKTLYIGDSLIDYKAAKKYNISFIFMYGYSQFYNWKEYFKNEKDIIFIRDFNTLVNCKC